MTTPTPPARRVALPMYDADRSAVEAFWHGIATALRAEGVARVAPALQWPTDLHAHWRDPELLLSQACGYPLVTALAGAVQVVGAFRYTAPGCAGIDYRSTLLVRRDEPGRRIEDFRGRHVAYSASDSYSGHHALRALVAPLAGGGDFFGRTTWTGSHRASLTALREGRADIAAIDNVTLAGLARHAAAEVEGLRVLGHTAAAPGLPLITSRRTPPDELAALRRALAAACDDPALRPSRERLFIGGFEPVPASTWFEAIAVEAVPAARRDEAPHALCG